MNSKQRRRKRRSGLKYVLELTSCIDDILTDIDNGKSTDEVRAELTKIKRLFAECKA